MDPRSLDLSGLAQDPWLERSADFAAGLGRAGTVAGGLLVVGTPQSEPWHFTAHLRDQAEWSHRPDLVPTLVRWSPPPGAPAHLAVGLERLRAAARGQTLLVSAPEVASEHLLERVADVRRAGGLVLALADEADELTQIAHDALAVPTGLVTHDLAEHLVSLGAGGPGDLTTGSRRAAGLLRRMRAAVTRT